MIFLGVDSGTQSTKTIAIDLDSGAIIASAQVPYGMIEGLGAGHMEQDPEVWVDATESTICGCVEQLGERKEEIRGIGISGQQHGLVPLDAQGNPVRNAKLWCDTSTVVQCEEFEKKFGGAEGLISLMGNTMLPGYTAPKVLWLKQNEPHHFAATETILLPHDYLNFWLTGHKVMEYGDASGTAMMNVETREWCQEIIDFIDPGVAEMLPALQSSAKPAGLLRNELCEKWGLSGEVLVSAGGGDNMMGAIGTGNTEAGRLTASLGTSGTLYGFSETPVIDPKGEVAAFCDSTDNWLPLVCTMNVTVATEQARGLFGLGVKEFDQEVANAAPGAEGVLFLPYLNGERTPNLPDGCGVLHGLNMNNMTQANIARASMEGATMGLAYGLKRFRELGMQPDEIRITGGGSNSAVWRQLAADVFGTQTVCLSTAEGAAMGAALQAAWTYSSVQGEGPGLEDLNARFVALDETTRCEPDAANVEFYGELLEKQSRLTRKLHDVGFL